MNEEKLSTNAPSNLFEEIFISSISVQFSKPVGREENEFD